MLRKLLPVLLLFMVLAATAKAVADGDIYVGGPWGTRIASLPYTITTPGCYYLGSNLSYAGTGDGITVDSGVNHVTLDLMGFTINGSGSGRYGIYINRSKWGACGINFEIRNGTVTGWGFGIKDSIDWEGNGKLYRIINLRVVGNRGGISIKGTGHRVKGCEVTATYLSTAIFIGQGTVNGCIVRFVDGKGIETGGGIIEGGAIISDNVVSSTGTDSYRDGILVHDSGTLIRGNKVSGCAVGINGGGHYGLNIIGNTVDAAINTTGISLADDYSNLLDQNTVIGAGTHYNAAYTKVTQRGTNY
jgi:hypothetical protein